MYEESELYKEHGFPFMSCRLKLSCSGAKWRDLSWVKH